MCTLAEHSSWQMGHLLLLRDPPSTHVEHTQQCLHGKSRIFRTFSKQTQHKSTLRRNK